MGTLKPQGKGPSTRWLVHWPLIGHPSTASVSTSYYSMWHYNYLCSLNG